MKQYETIDKLIVKAIQDGRNPLYHNEVVNESDRLATMTGREGFRIIDGRLSALRKNKTITHLTKAQAPGGVGGWYLVEEKP